MRRRAVAAAKNFKARRPFFVKSRLYGVGEERFELEFDKGCRICGAGKWTTNVRLHADHDHRTNTFRGVLCENCNLGIGKFYEDPMLLISAVVYLQESIR